MPTSLLYPAFFLAGDPGLQGRDREFVENLRDLLLRGLELSPGHREQLLGMYQSRHALNTAAYRGRWARIVEAARV